MYAAYEFAHFGQGVQIYDPCVILKPHMVSLGAGCRLDSFCKVEGGLGVTIGENTHIASFCHLNGGGGSVIIGAHSGCASGVKIAGGYCDYDFLHVSAAEPPEHCHVIRKRTTIGEYCVIFTSAVILPGVTVGDGAIVAAGAVVARNVEPWAIVAGNPAKVVGKREVCRP